MTDVRETLNYESLLGAGPGEVRETLSYMYVLGTDPSSVDTRETLGYQSLLGTDPTSSNVRETLSYATILARGAVGDRDTLTYFTLLGAIAPLPTEDCGLLSFIAPGPFGLGAPMGSEPVARASSFGPKGIYL